MAGTIQTDHPEACRFVEILRFPAIATYADWRRSEAPDMEKASLVAYKDDLLGGKCLFRNPLA